MNILISGDSFSDNKNPHAWPNYYEGHKVINRAVGCHSNLSISRTIIESVTESDIDFDYVICEWSTPMRASYKRFAPEPYQRIKHKECVGIASFENSDVYKSFEFYTSESVWLRTLENILRTQWFLETKKLKYKFFFGWNISFIEAIRFFPELSKLINFDNWWIHETPMGPPYPHAPFTEGSEEYSGMAEWCVDNGIELEPDGHPTNKGHEMFYKELASKWIYE